MYRPNNLAISRQFKPQPVRDSNLSLDMASSGSWTTFLSLLITAPRNLKKQVLIHESFCWDKFCLSWKSKQNLVLIWAIQLGYPIHQNCSEPISWQYNSVFKINIILTTSLLKRMAVVLDSSHFKIVAANLKIQKPMWGIIKSVCHIRDGYTRNYQIEKEEQNV